MSGATATALDAVEAFAFDLDGTLYLAQQLLPGAGKLLAGLEASGRAVVFATNNSSMPATDYQAKLRSLGLPADRSVLLTSNDVAVSYLKERGYRRPWLLATDAVRHEYGLEGLGHDEADPDCLLLTFDTSLDYQKLLRASRLIEAGIPYLATHPDPVCPSPAGGMPDCGAIIELLHATTGARPVVLGKPYVGMASAIVERLGYPAERIAFVGDRLQTDMRMASDFGFVGVLTLTGVTGHDELRSSELQPPVVVQDMVDLARLLGLG